MKLASTQTTYQISIVVAVHSNNVTFWDYMSYPYVDFIDPIKLKIMLDKGLMTLTDTINPKDAWENLFPTYCRGDIIAIKPNFNDLYMEFKGFVTSPALINAIVDGLKEYIGVPAKEILIYDCSRGIPDAFRNRVQHQVKYIEGAGTSFWRRVKKHTIERYFTTPDLNKKIDMGIPVNDEEGRPVDCYLPKCLTNVKHLINVPILKSHQFVLASGALKNHYGTVRFSDGMGSPLYLHPPIINQAIASLNAHFDLQKKIRLIVMDGLFGRHQKKGGAPDKWLIFGGNSPNRLYLSKDSVALDSITSSFIKRELVLRKEEPLSDEYLRLAQEAGVGNMNLIDFQEIGV